MPLCGMPFGKTSAIGISRAIEKMLKPVNTSLPGDDPPAVRQRVDEGVDERLIVETHFTARGIPGVVTLEATETVDEPIGLRAVVVRQDRETIAEDPVI